MTASLLDIVILLIGLYFVYGIMFKPAIFWERGRILRTRKVLGDQNTLIFYGILGSIMVIVGILGAYGALG
ncbi:MAG: hypothetical protein AAF490_05415 [Chloroflexota bacterium]